MQKVAKRYKLKLNSTEKIEELLQELYNEACENIKVSQDQLNAFTTSANLNNECADAKAKIGKVINDFLANKDKAIGRKLEIAKLMSDIFKFNGNIQKASEQEEPIGDWDMLKDKLKEEEGNDVQEYQLK